MGKTALSVKGCLASGSSVADALSLARLLLSDEVREAITIRTVDTHIRRLRAKPGRHAQRLETVRAEGYRNFPIERDSHVKNAVLSAMALQDRWGSRRFIGGGESQMAIGVGVGIHTGTVAIGEVGEACRDFTAVGSVVNLASRLQDVACPKEVLVTEAVYECVAEQFPNAPKRVYETQGARTPRERLGAETRGLIEWALTRRLAARHASGAEVPEVCRGDRWRRRAQNLY